MIRTSTAMQRLRPLLLLAMLVLPAAACREPASQVRHEIERLQREVAAKPAAEAAWRDAKPGLASGLSQAGAELRAGRLYVSLEGLGEVLIALRAVDSVQGGARSQEQGLPGFESAWRRAGAELGAAGERRRQRARERHPVAVRALAETAHGRSSILLAASRAYAGVTSPAAGYYYLGEARGAAEMASFCRSLRLAPRAAAPPLRSLAPELRRLQEQADAAFQPPRSIQLHGSFIGLSATLKLAGELDAARLHAGALYQYLDAVEQLGLLAPATPTAADAARQGALRARIAALHAELGGARSDHSIGQLFLERAAAPLAGTGAAAPGPDSWRRAGVIVEQVLPAYFAALAPVAPQPRLAAQPITVTLVRWPYT
jgi:hypothetical protein